MDIGSRRRPVSRPGELLTALAVLNVVGALAGSVGLATGLFGKSLTASLPWDSSLFAGAALALLVALPNGILAVLALRHNRHTGLAGVLVGVAMVVWILVQLAFLRDLSFLHPLYIAVGLVMIWAGARVLRYDLGVPARVLAEELRDVVMDVPLFLGAPVVRPWHLRWGATDGEVAATLPGDERLDDPDYVATRAITIDAPPERVWPWLAQVGRGRAGFYSDDLLDNGAVPSAAEIRPELQRLAVGQWVPMAERISPQTAFRVASVEAPYRLLWAKPDSTWCWVLTRTDDGGTRLVTRIRAIHDRLHPGAALTSLLLLEHGDFAMQRRMLLHLRERVERTAPTVSMARGFA